MALILIKNIILAILLLSISPQLLAQETKSMQYNEKKNIAIVFGLDNDLFVGSDDYYTNGVFIGVISSSSGSFQNSLFPEFFGKLLDHIPGLNPEERLAHCSFSLAHRIFTPHDIEKANPILNDIPYSGQLTFDFSVSTQNFYHLDAWTLTTGLTGPLSGAAPIQKNIHKAIGSTKPGGWEYQLKNELLINLFYEHRYRFYELSKKSRIFDAMMIGAVGMGNLTSYAEIGLGFRFGLNIPDDFFAPTPFFADPTIGIMPTTSKTGITCYIFANISGSLVANSIILDGNTFRESQSVDYNPAGLRANTGLAMDFKGIHITWTLTYSTIPWDNPERKKDDFFTQISFFCVF